MSRRFANVLRLRRFGTEANGGTVARFDGKSAVVTGAGSGFGRAIALRLAEEGACVLCADIDDANGGAVARDIVDAGGAAESIRVDVAQAADVEAMVERCVERFGSIDILVNNAGYSHRSRLMWKLSEEDFDGVFAVNVKGVFLGCKFAVPHMIEAGGGVIVNTASIGAVTPRAGVTPYNASKGAVVTMTRGLAGEVARHNIRVNAVNPVAAETGFMKGALGVDKLDNEAKSNIVAGIPRGRLAEPADVAAAVCFLASGDADMITGTALNVDGGRSI